MASPHPQLQLVTASADGTARVYNTMSGACQSILIGHEGEISKVRVGCAWLYARAPASLLIALRLTSPGA